MASDIPRGPEEARGQTGEQGTETEAGKRVCVNQLRGHGNVKYIQRGSDLSVNNSNIKTTYRMG